MPERHVLIAHLLDGDKPKAITLRGGGEIRVRKVTSIAESIGIVRVIPKRGTAIRIPLEDIVDVKSIG